MSPEARFYRVLDSFAWVEYFRGTPAGRTVASELETGFVGTPLIVLAELRDKYVRERIPDWPKDLAFLKAMSEFLPVDEAIAVRAGETKNRMRAQGRKDFRLVDAVVYETARATGAILVPPDPHYRGLDAVQFIG